LEKNLTLHRNVHKGKGEAYRMYGKAGEECAGFWWGDLWERNHLEDLIKMDLIFKWDEEAWTGLVWTMIGTVVGVCECDSEPLGSIKCGEFLDWLRRA